LVVESPWHKQIKIENDGKYKLDFSKLPGPLIFKIDSNKIDIIRVDNNDQQYTLKFELDGEKRVTDITGSEGADEFILLNRLQNPPKINLYGDEGNDWFTLSDGANFAGRIDGGEGRNTLNYGGKRDNHGDGAVIVKSQVEVRLSNASPDGAIYRIQNVIGGSNNNTLVGNDETLVITEKGPPKSPGHIQHLYFNTLPSSEYSFVLSYGAEKSGDIIFKPNDDTANSLNLEEAITKLIQDHHNANQAHIFLNGKGAKTDPWVIEIYIPGADDLDPKKLSEIIDSELFGGKKTEPLNGKGDTLIGKGGNDILKGKNGKDYLAGGAGRDTLEGGEGDDTLDGGPGGDNQTPETLKGGRGDDIYRFSNDWGVDKVDEETNQDTNDSLDFSGVTKPIAVEIKSNSGHGITVIEGNNKVENAKQVERIVGSSADGNIYKIYEKWGEKLTIDNRWGDNAILNLSNISKDVNLKIVISKPRDGSAYNLIEVSYNNYKLKAYNIADVVGGKGKNTYKVEKGGLLSGGIQPTPYEAFLIDTDVANIINEMPQLERNPVTQTVPPNLAAKFAGSQYELKGPIRIEKITGEWWEISDKEGKHYAIKKISNTELQVYKYNNAIIDYSGFDDQVFVNLDNKTNAVIPDVYYNTLRPGTPEKQSVLKVWAHPFPLLSQKFTLVIKHFGAIDPKKRLNSNKLTVTRIEKIPYGTTAVELENMIKHKGLDVKVTGNGKIDDPYLIFFKNPTAIEDVSPANQFSVIDFTKIEEFGTPRLEEVKTIWTDTVSGSFSLGMSAFYPKMFQVHSIADNNFTLKIITKDDDPRETDEINIIDAKESPEIIEQELNKLGISRVQVSGKGTRENPWLVHFLDEGIKELNEEPNASNNVEINPFQKEHIQKLREKKFNRADNDLKDQIKAWLKNNTAGQRENDKYTVEIVGNGTMDKPWEITFTDPYFNIPDITVKSDPAEPLLQEGIVNVVPNYSDRTQTIYIPNALSQGIKQEGVTGTFEIGNEKIKHDDTAATVEEKLKATLANQNIKVTGNPGGPWKISFETSASQQSDKPQTTSDPYATFITKKPGNVIGDKVVMSGGSITNKATAVFTVGDEPLFLEARDTGTEFNDLIILFEKRVLLANSRCDTGNGLITVGFKNNPSAVEIAEKLNRTEGISKYITARTSRPLIKVVNNEIKAKKIILPERWATGIGTPGKIPYTSEVIGSKEKKNFIFGGSAPVKITGGDNVDKIMGGTGNDNLNGAGGADKVHGGPGDDKIDGGGGNDWLYGDAGNDKIVGKEGNNDGNDFMYGGDGNDLLNGGGGFDVIEGGHGDDNMQGGSGKDWLKPGPGNDLLDGGGGKDGGDNYILDDGWGIANIVENDKKYRAKGDRKKEKIDVTGDTSSWKNLGYRLSRAITDDGDIIDFAGVYRDYTHIISRGTLVSTPGHLVDGKIISELRKAVVTGDKDKDDIKITTDFLSRNKIQTIMHNGVEGHFKLKYNTVESEKIAYNASAKDLKKVLNKLVNDVNLNKKAPITLHSLTGPNGGPWTVRFSSWDPIIEKLKPVAFELLCPDEERPNLAIEIPTILGRKSLDDLKGIIPSPGEVRIPSLLGFGPGQTAKSEQKGGTVELKAFNPASDKGNASKVLLVINRGFGIESYTISIKAYNGRDDLRNKVNEALKDAGLQKDPLEGEGKVTAKLTSELILEKLVIEVTSAKIAGNIKPPEHTSITILPLPNLHPLGFQSGRLVKAATGANSATITADFELPQALGTAGALSFDLEINRTMGKEVYRVTIDAANMNSYNEASDLKEYLNGVGGDTGFKKAVVLAGSRGAVGSELDIRHVKTTPLNTTPYVTADADGEKLKITVNGLTGACRQLGDLVSIAVVASYNTVVVGIEQPEKDIEYVSASGMLKHIEQIVASPGDNTFVFGNNWGYETNALASALDWFPMLNGETATGFINIRRELVINTEEVVKSGKKLVLDFRPVNKELSFSFATFKDVTSLEIERAANVGSPLVGFEWGFPFSRITVTHTDENTVIYGGRDKNTIVMDPSTQKVGNEYKGYFYGGEGIRSFEWSNTLHTPFEVGFDLLTDSRWPDLKVRNSLDISGRISMEGLKANTLKSLLSGVNLSSNHYGGAARL